MKTDQKWNIGEIKPVYEIKVPKNELMKIENSEDAYKVLKEIYNPQTISLFEEMVMLCLNRGNRVIGWYKVSTGGFSSTVVDPKVIYSMALVTASSFIILCHNHPSGQCIPSDSDISITRKVKQGGDLLDIKLLDHIIITDSEFYSFANEGQL